jgi:serine/threonine protein phosphatase PrpC
MNPEDFRSAATQEGLAVGFAGQACGKPVSEDFFDMACPSPADRDARGLVFALADGMSGGAGRRAAETCVRTVLSDFYATPMAWEVARGLDRVIGSVNGWLLAHNLRSAESECMLATLSVLVLHADRFHVGHVGDSRIYRLRDGQCECLTTDHVWPRADMRHVLRRAVGLDHHLVVDCFSDALTPGDRFVMLSDGVWEVLGEAGVRETLAANAGPEALATALVERSAQRQRRYYGRNDATAAIVEVRSVPAPASA